MEPAAEILAHRRIPGQHHQPVRRAFQTEFTGRTQHAVRLDAAHPGDLDFDSRQDRPGPGARHLEPGCRVRGAAHDGDGRRFADVDLAHAQAVGIGMLLSRQDLGHHHVAERRRDRRQRFDL